MQGKEGIEKRTDTEIEVYNPLLICPPRFSNLPTAVKYMSTYNSHVGPALFRIAI